MRVCVCVCVGVGGYGVCGAWQQRFIVECSLPSISFSLCLKSEHVEHLEIWIHGCDGLSLSGHLCFIESKIEPLGFLICVLPFRN